MEYGLYSTMSDGSFSMSPHGGLVLDVGSNWQADAVIRKQIVSGEACPLETENRCQHLEHGRRYPDYRALSIRLI